MVRPRYLVGRVYIFTSYSSALGLSSLPNGWGTGCVLVYSPCNNGCPVVRYIFSTAYWHMVSRRCMPSPCSSQTPPLESPTPQANVHSVDFIQPNQQESGTVPSDAHPFHIPNPKLWQFHLIPPTVLVPSSRPLPAYQTFLLISQSSILNGSPFSSRLPQTSSRSRSPTMSSFLLWHRTGCCG